MDVSVPNFRNTSVVVLNSESVTRNDLGKCSEVYSFTTKITYCIYIYTHIYIYKYIYIDLTDVFRCKACSVLGNALIKARTWQPNGEKILKEWVWAETVALPPENILALSFQELTNRVEFIFGRHVADTHCNHCVATFCFLLTPAVPSCCASWNIFFHFVSLALLFETHVCSE